MSIHILKKEDRWRTSQSIAMKLHLTLAFIVEKIDQVSNQSKVILEKHAFNLNCQAYIYIMVMHHLLEENCIVFTLLSHTLKSTFTFTSTPTFIRCLFRSLSCQYCVIIDIAKHDIKILVLFRSFVNSVRIIFPTHFIIEYARLKNRKRQEK
jgi:hypothetical protein